VNHWFAAFILVPLAAGAAHSEPRQLQSLNILPPKTESRLNSLRFRVVEDPVFSATPLHNSGMIAQTTIAGNASLGIGLLKVAPRKPGSGEYRSDMGARSSRKAAVRFTLKF